MIHLHHLYRRELHHASKDAYKVPSSRRSAAIGAADDFLAHHEPRYHVLRGELQIGK